MRASLSSSINNSQIRDAIARVKAHNAAGGSHTDIMNYETPLLPTAYVFKIEILSTQGDPHYVGLNGITLYDANNEQIPLTANNVQAVPRDVTVLVECSKDPRTLPKLIDGWNRGTDDQHMWLAPFGSGKPNFIYLIFEEPVAVSRMEFWNYAKTPDRGVKDLMVWADDILIYNGSLQTTSAQMAQQYPQALLFTNDQKVVGEYAQQSIATHKPLGEDIVFYNDQHRLEHKTKGGKGALPDYQLGARPGTRSGPHD
mmetsp:Transcript_45163/g.76057  ORF Transcript_45163/g.76057 Transcript_45163/m.76057 type:complete len:256 (+) Transcript_45163:2-769(+)